MVVAICVSLLEFDRDSEVVVSCVLEHETFNAVEFSNLHGDPIRLILVAAALVRHDEVVPPACRPVTNGNLLTGGLNRCRFVELVSI